MTEAIKNAIKWTWLGPLLITLIAAMSAAWAVNQDRRVLRLEEAMVETLKARADDLKIRGEILGALNTIVEQNRGQDIRMTQISSRVDTLINQHIPPTVFDRRLR